MGKPDFQALARTIAEPCAFARYSEADMEGGAECAIGGHRCRPCRNRDAIADFGAAIWNAAVEAAKVVAATEIIPGPTDAFGSGGNTAARAILTATHALRIPAPNTAGAPDA